MNSLVAIGSQTQWGRVVAISCVDGERYYFMQDMTGVVAMMPAVDVEHTSAESACA